MSVLSISAPIILAALAFMFAAKCGFYNLGIEGQLVVGILSAAVFSSMFKNIPGVFYLLLCIAISCAISCAWALLPALLRINKGLNEAIVTLFFNLIAFLLAPGFLKLINFKISEEAFISSSQVIKFAASDFKALGGIDMGFVVVLVAVYIINNVFSSTVFGFESRAAGFDAKAKEKGINVNKRIIGIFAISGILAGLTGILIVFGGFGAEIAASSFGCGYEGMAVALLVNNNPFGIVFFGLLFGVLTYAGSHMLDGNHYFMLIKAVIIFISILRPFVIPLYPFKKSG